jgi:solute carrier family 25 carnitine/acylcarnitine transporter 20/29
MADIGVGAASFTIYNRTKEHFRNNNYLIRNTVFDVALTGGISGAVAGALISFGCARKRTTLSSAGLD